MTTRDGDETTRSLRAAWSAPRQRATLLALALASSAAAEAEREAESEGGWAAEATLLAEVRRERRRRERDGRGAGAGGGAGTLVRGDGSVRALLRLLADAGVLEARTRPGARLVRPSRETSLGGALFEAGTPRRLAEEGGGATLAEWDEAAAGDGPRARARRARLRGMTATQLVDAWERGDVSDEEAAGGGAESVDGGAAERAAGRVAGAAGRGER